MGKARHSRDWNEVDWTRPLGEIAQEMGVSLSVAGGRGNQFLKGRWLMVDWTRPNNSIADDLNVSRQRVHVQRKKFEKGELGTKRTGRPPKSAQLRSER
jgi:hypothetical protein